MSEKQTEALKLALEKAFDLGKRYWQQANSDFTSQWRKSDVTLASFNQLVEDTIRDALAEQPAHESAYQRGYMDGIAKGLRMEQPAQPPECKTDAEKTAFAFGWWKALEENRKQPAKQEPVTVLPDGSAFAVMSYPLPKDHWLYADRQYNDGADEPVELGKPILTHEMRDAVVSAVRYAIRGATNCGKEVDFDPDALVQNAVYALCGPFTSPQPAQQQEPVACPVCNEVHAILDADGSKIIRNAADGYPDGREQRVLTLQERVTALCVYAADWKRWCLEKENTSPPPRKPLTDEEIWDEVKAADLDWQTGWSLDEDAPNRYITFARAIEAAHGIKGEKNGQAT